ncbi:MAG: hypothetical protein ACPGWR_28330 [Ardenticatenaceae bacterium]
MEVLIINLLLFFSIVNIGILMAYSNQKEENWRSQELKKVASEIDFTFSYDGHDISSDKLRDFSLYSKADKSRRKKKNVLKGVIKNIEITIFDYTYQKKQVPPILHINSQEVQQTVILLEPASPPLLRAYLEKKQLISSYHSYQPLKGLKTEERDRQLMIYKPSRRLAPRQIPQFIAQALEAYQKGFGVVKKGGKEQVGAIAVIPRANPPLGAKRGALSVMAKGKA